MTEDEWLTSAQSQLMLNWLQPFGFERKLRLFACACCRDMLRVVPGAKHLDAVEFAERYADGTATEPERLACVENGRRWDMLDPLTAESAIEMAAVATAYHNSACLNSAMESSRFAASVYKGDSWRMHYADLARDIFGNPFDPVTFPARWLTRDVLAIAQGIYDARDFSAMPILADALQDAGCDDGVILTHCRGPGPHVRGCFVVDGVTGRR